MQRTRTNRRIIHIILCVVVFAVLLAVDQLTKYYFKNKYLESGQTQVIKDFFYFSYAENTGSAFSFLAGKSWAQTFFKIITAVALFVFVTLIVVSYKKKQTWLMYSFAVTVAGTVGNFIDRLFLNYVRDFILFIFGEYRFPVFNVADMCLVVGVIMIVIHFLFIDKDAVFKKKDGKKDLSSNDGN